MLKLAGKQIKMDRILTETDSIDEISCFLSMLHVRGEGLHAKNKSDLGKYKTRYSIFGTTQRR